MGAKLRQIRRRRNSVESTMKITRAMELIATSRIVKATQRVQQARPYARRIQEALRELTGVAEVEAEFPLLRAREQVRTLGMLVITSDRGLAGGYNANVIRIAEEELHRAERAGQAYRLHIVGKKGLSYFRFRGYPIASSITGVSDMPRYETAVEMGDRLMREFEEGETDRVLIAYTDFRSAGSQTVTTTQVLPVAREEISRPAGEVSALYEFEPEPARIMSLLLPRYVTTVVFAALLESSASEHAARRRAMKAATENAEDLIGVLNRIINRERQAEITTEIMDVVGGAEALRKAEKAGV